MVEMLKREFDNSVVLDEVLKRLLQRFEYDHANEPKSFVADFAEDFKTIKETTQKVWMDRKVWEFQFKRLFFLSFLFLCLDLCLNHCLDLRPYMVRESG